MRNYLADQRKNNRVVDFHIDVTDLLPVSEEVTAYYRVEYKECKAEPQNGIWQPYNELYELILLSICDTSGSCDVVIDVDIDSETLAKIDTLALEYVGQL